MRFATILAILAFAPGGATAQERSIPDDAVVFAEEADAFITTALEQLPEVPGLAMAVVVDDRIVLSRGYGQADIERGVPATADAAYYIASATKPYTALAAAILHERGTIDLDSSLASHLRGGGMDPALVGEGVTLRDLLSHTAGLSNSPVTIRLAYTGEHSPELLWRLLSATEANSAGPGNYEYTNFGYNLLTIILDRELGRTWQDVLQEEIFDPAGLARTTAYASRPGHEGWPLAAPYFGMHPDGLQRVPLVKIDATMQSAGGMMTTADDAARWMLLQLNDGKLDDRQVVPVDVIRTAQTSRVATEREKRGGFGTEGCALGWQIGSYADHQVLHHSGGYPGFRSLISFMPGEKVGVAIFVNEGTVGSLLPDALAAWAYDWWLGRDTASHAEAVAGIAAMRDKFAGRMAQDRERRAARTWALSMDPAAYAGRYSHPDYGTLNVTAESGALAVDLGHLHSVAEPFTKPESMRVEMVPGQGEVMVFVLENGLIAGLDYDGTVFVREN